ncbi:MAG: DUF494 domain-containing protein [Candidatus Nitricoxidivorans perseverans]|uniref:Protein Smg homolog n=1 Tax=Candidatus Nitricoxidivorans perseverans TaxID=2975601 RepID=A0AA49IX25_9PROT|nr:MAG: DUF494 domain-containing protein [Candidatus Nitricoxidivorans perseverans]
MYDILVYLFENYLPDACPEPDALARKLAAAGFGDADITEALDWLAGLDQVPESGGFLHAPQPDSLRLYDPREAARLPADCRGFLAFLEAAGGIDAAVRERIVERALALEDAVVTLAKLKVIVLMVMWRRQLPLDALVFEELLAEEDDEPLLH